MEKNSKPVVKNSLLCVDSANVQVNSLQWYEWLSVNKSFTFQGGGGHFIAQCETRRDKAYWYAYRRRAGKLSKVYLGKSDELTYERLEQASVSLAGQTLLAQYSNKPGEISPVDPESHIGTTFLPIVKVNVPVLPQKLVVRPRLTRQINTPLTLIYAPSGFGKSTLLNEWKQTCGFPVAWLSLDENDNDPLRFWYSLVMVLQTINPGLGQEIPSYLHVSSPIHLTEIVSRLTNDIVQVTGNAQCMGLVLDDFHRIHCEEIYDSLQAWLEYFPPTLQLMIAGHIKPPLTLGHLRAKGMVTELDANDLRFTLEESVNYLLQYPQDPPLAYGDIEKLAGYTEGWAAGLTLTALALGKQEDRRQFVDTFSGAHIYLREYFMETVLQRSSSEVQSFLLKTAILKHLTGSLCDAITGQSGGGEMLARLWHENLFIVRLEEQGWYRYHDLFAEMLLSQLQIRFPEEVPQLHQRAAQWYRERYAPADAIYHLLATEAWEEAAALMEEMALRELELYGEDSRLLRWLQELPESVVQKHKNLLFVYLRLANVALPQKKIETFITHIEMSISSKSAVSQTQDQRDVLAEIQQIRRTWAQGDIFTPPSRTGNEYDARWDVLNRLHLLKQVNSKDQNSLEGPIIDLLHTAQVQHNLFVILMAGGVLARLAIVAGQLRRSEKLSHQVLEQALTQRGKLPEPASITLAVLSQIHLERNEIELAQKYLVQMGEVDPNPASTNMFVQAGILRAKIQAAQYQAQEARATIQAIRKLHVRRPSGLWTDQDLLAYEALICIRIGDISSAEQLLNESENSDHHLSQLGRAEVFLRKNRFEAAETQLNYIMTKYPNGIVFEPLLVARVPLALALFGQHKINQALQTMTEAIRLAAPEHFLRPFLDNGIACAPLLALALQAENLTNEAQIFVKELSHRLDPTGKYFQISKTEMEILTTSASISAREQEVLSLLNGGYSNREMAGKLSISESTIKTHLGNIYYKLNVNSRTQAITRAKELKLV